MDLTKLLPYAAYAKINLCLEILGKRPDRFHNIATVMQTISLADAVYIGPAEDLEFDCNIEELVTEDNLVWRAALLLHDLCPSENKRGAAIFLEKNIPVAAGLGGGSSDAAATLVALNQLWNLGLSTEQLERQAANLGSDVPFFIRGGTLLAEGRGDEVTFLPPLAKTWLVLVYPEIEVPENKTAELYNMLDRTDYTAGTITRQLVKTLNNGQQPSPSLFFNGFEQVVYRRFQALDHYRQRMVSAGADYVRVSGSGPTLYTVVESEQEGQEILDKLLAEDIQAYLASTITP